VGKNESVKVVAYYRRRVVKERKGKHKGVKPDNNN
jgi:hypothetical protein